MAAHELQVDYKTVAHIFQGGYNMTTQKQETDDSMTERDTQADYTEPLPNYMRIVALHT